METNILNKCRCQNCLKVTAARIIKVLPEIIHTNQTGYVKDRFIGEAARSFIDVMEYTKQQIMPGILLFIDFEKAFDSIDWNFMLKCLDVFGFGRTHKTGRNIL